MTRQTFSRLPIVCSRSTKYLSIRHLREKYKYRIQRQRREKFLREKNFFSKYRSRQSEEFAWILDPSKAPSELLSHYKKAQARLDVLLVGSDSLADSVPTDVQTFDQFCEIVPAWGRPADSWVFHRDHSSVKGKDVLRQRAQLSGLCYLHAPDMLQHDLVSMRSTEAVGMVDICSLIRDSFSTEQLEKHIFEEEGGSSVNILETILVKDSIVTATSWHLYRKLLKKYGPGLVSTFRVYPDFFDRAASHHHGEPNRTSSDKPRMHSMILIGYRTDSRGKIVYLLQNWWKSKQFVEVDAEYLKKCGAVVYFVETPQTHIPSGFTVDLAPYAEFMDNKGELCAGGEY